MEKYLSLLPPVINLKGNYARQEVQIDGVRLNPRQSISVKNMSPTGFAWGYGGSGPSQLALALLLHYWPQDIALRYYQRFKEAFVAALPQTDFVQDVSLREILTAIVNKFPITLP